ncbi:MAG: 30S ribosomal protein S1, partial [Roseiflexaceae bacterium]|nr:30S ribosomal protein S1 [Roseiflexaceae bacterium]
MEQQERATADEHSEYASIHATSTPNGQSAEEAEDRALMEQFLLNPAHDYRNLQ